MARCVKQASWVFLFIFMHLNVWAVTALMDVDQTAPPAKPLFFISKEMPKPEKLTPLQEALVNKDADALRAAIKGGADIDAADTEGNFPLLLAAAYGDDVMLQILINNNINLIVRDAKGRTAMHYLAMRGDVASMKFLMVMNRTLVLIADVDGWTPLYTAYANQHFEVAEYLIDGEYDHLNRPNEKRVPRAFQFVSSVDHPRAIKHMIERKLNIFKRNINDQTLHEVALEAGHPYSAELLELYYERILDEYKKKLQRENPK